MSTAERDQIAPEFAGYVAALREGRLAAPRCLACGRLQWPPRELCVACHADAFSWETMPARGVVHTFTITNRAFHPSFADRVPYAVLVVDVGDGVRYLGNYEGDVGEVVCGLPVEAVFPVATDAIPALHWRRAEAPHA